MSGELVSVFWIISGGVVIDAGGIVEGKVVMLSEIETGCIIATKDKNNTTLLIHAGNSD